MINVDELAQAIREVDGNHSLGAGALAEAILAKLPQFAARQPPAQGIDLGPFTRLADAWVLAAHDAGKREGKVLKEAIMLMAVKELRDTVEQVSQRDAAPGVG